MHTTVCSQISFLFINVMKLLPLCAQNRVWTRNKNMFVDVHVISVIITENKMWCSVEMCLQMNIVRGGDGYLSPEKSCWPKPLMWSAVSLLTGQDGKLLFTSLIHVLSENTNCVCVWVGVCVWVRTQGCTMLSVPMRTALEQIPQKQRTISQSVLWMCPLFLSASWWWLSFIHGPCALFNPPFIFSYVFQHNVPDHFICL